MRHTPRRVATTVSRRSIVALLATAAFAGTAGLRSARAATLAYDSTILVREVPGYGANVVYEAAPGSWVEIIGPEEWDSEGLGWLPVSVDGVSGYVPTETVLADPVAEETAPVESAWESYALYTLDAVNLRSEPHTESEILAVVDPANEVWVDGDPIDGYFPVTALGLAGWIDGSYLGAEPPAALPASDSGADQAPEANRRNSFIAWPFAGGTWQVIQGYNNGTHQNRSEFAQYQHSLDWARVDGETAGTRIHAPVSGTVDWTDPASGGLLIVVGNGYGIAMFHMTLDRSIGPGSWIDQGQVIGFLSGPGEEGYMSTPHLDITCWDVSGGGHRSVPFVGETAIGGMDFPSTGAGNEHMDETVSLG